MATVTDENGVEYHSEEQLRYTRLFKRCSFMGDDGSYSRDNHWKMPLRVVVEADEADEMSRAIVYFTGGVPSREETEDGLIKLESEGYFVHIGS